MPPTMGPKVGSKTILNPQIPTAILRRSGEETLKIEKIARGYPAPVGGSL